MNPNDPGVYRPTAGELDVAGDLMRRFSESIKAVIEETRAPHYNATLMALMNLLILLLVELRKQGPHQENMVPKSMRHFANRLNMLADARDATAMQQLARDTSDLQRKN